MCRTKLVDLHVSSGIFSWAGSSQWGYVAVYFRVRSEARTCRLIDYDSQVIVLCLTESSSSSLFDFFSLGPFICSVLHFRVDPFTRKDWYDVKAPSMFTTRQIGKTLVNRTQGTKIASEGLKHRVFEVSLADLQNDNDAERSFRKFRLIAEDVQGRNVLTNFHGMDLTTDKLRSMVKKWQVSSCPYFTSIQCSWCMMKSTDPTLIVVKITLSLYWHLLHWKSLCTFMFPKLKYVNTQLDYRPSLKPT